LNKALTYANGEYVQFLSLDDVLIVDKFKVQVELLQNNQGCIFAYSDVSYIDKNNEIIFKSRFENRNLPYASSGFIFQDLMLHGYFINAPSVLWNFEKMNFVGRFDEQLCVEDIDYVYRSCIKFPVVFSNQVSVKYRYLDNSLSHKSSIKFEVDVVKVKLKYLNHFKGDSTAVIYTEIRDILIKKSLHLFLIKLSL
jgi:hypothetical protein